MFWQIKNPVSSINRYKGFTLLELVLVLFILAILTTTGLSFLENEDGQLRFNQSLQKQETIVNTIFNETFDNNQRVMSGFVIDNGVLPSIGNADTASQRIAHFLSNTDGWETFTAHTVQLDTNGVPVASGDGYQLFKGFSNSSYLYSDSSGTGNFRDAWGGEFFISDITTNQFTIGYDGDGGLDFDGDLTADETQTSKPTLYSNDNDTIIAQEDWTVDVNQLNLLLTNTTCAPRAAPCTYEVAVAVFRNAGTCANPNEINCWDTYHFTTIALADGATHDTTINATAWQQNGGAIVDSRIPAGEHIAIALQVAGNASADTNTFSRFKVFPNATQPTVTLTVP